MAFVDGREIMFSWSFQRSARFIKPYDDFFEQGNKACFQNSRQRIDDPDIDDLLACFSNVSLKQEELFCNVKGCKETFFNIKAFELHQLSKHAFICSTCRRNFPTNALLDIHITENHDSLFATKVQQGQFVFVCVVETCDIKFKSGDERAKHLVEFHKYPSDFRFIKKKKQTTTHKKLVADPEKGDEGESMDATCEERSKSADEKDFEINMNTDDQNPNSNVNGKKLPKNITFGRGSSRAFQTRKSGKKR